MPVGTTLDEARADPAPAQGREAARRRPAVPAEGPHHRQGHPEGRQVPERVQGRPRPAARRRGRRRRPGTSLERAEALVAAHVDVLVVDTAHGHSQRVLDIVRELRRRLPGRRPRRRQRGDRRGDRGPDRARRRRREGRHRRRLDLHDARRRRHRRADDHGRRSTAPAPRRRTTCPSSPTAASGTPATSPRRSPSGAASRHDRQPVRRHRREPRRGRSSTRAAASRNTAAWGRSARCAAAAATATSRTSSTSTAAATAARSSCPRASRAASPTRAASPRMIHQLVGGLRPAWATAAAATSPTLQRDAQLIRITPAGVRESHVHDVDHHEGSAELPVGVGRPGRLRQSMTISRRSPPRSRT